VLPCGCEPSIVVAEIGGLLNPRLLSSVVCFLA